MWEVVQDFTFVLRHYPLECLFVAVVCGGTGMFIGAAIMRYAMVA